MMVQKGSFAMKILVVVDMQKDFIDGSLGTREAPAIVPNVVEKIRRMPPEAIFVTRDTHTADYLSTTEGRHLPVPHCIQGTPGHDLHPAVAAALADVPADHFVDKPSFGSTELPQRIRRVAGDQPLEIQLVGLCTGICVLSNAIVLKAAFPEAELSVDAACCACVSPQSHDTALAALPVCQITVENQGKEPWRN